MSATGKSSSEVFSEERSDQVKRLSRKVFGRLPERVAFPGGTSRTAFIADMGDERCVFARRENSNDAQLEGIVLKALGSTGKVPQLRAVEDDWVVQQFVTGERLPVVMDRTENADERERLTADALDSLHALHEAARTVGLQHRVPRIGVADNWLWNRTGAAKRISVLAGIEAPALDRHRLVQFMNVKRDEFVKWDARPGNAMVTPSGSVWFDWEDCGRSKALDDLAFVICDEWSNLTVEAEQRLLNSYLPAFSGSMDRNRAHHYLRNFGITHMLLRLRLATKNYHRDDEWWDRDYCLAGDKVGVTAQEVSRLIDRLQRWSDGVEEWAPLTPWLCAVHDRYGLG
ncbi:phosphotransferase [Ahrensia sp. R2A130]|uniref:phosphotransferase n=1 Tax=Ahrensia sp. R2A130 TaxID=744979 RepID=UPI0001E0D0DA|nr:phosphotransferase [Ahrensia sp. R2A130]EFL89251.1 hypothetical protein R2A130_3000 [Ahrensia sp. R2A130]